MRRHRLHSAAAALLVTAGVVLATGIAAAQTTTTTTAPPATTTPTTVPTTTPASTLSPVTTAAGGQTTATTAAPATSTVPVLSTSDDGDDGGGIPWIPIAIAAAVVVAIVAVVAVMARKRGAKRQRAADWRHEAADATAEAGATARLLSQGTPPSGQIAQQLLASLRTFEDLARAAPDESAATTAERARRALQTLGLAIDADYRLRRGPAPADAQELARSQESVQNAAGETDRTLRGVYRTFTGVE